MRVDSSADYVRMTRAALAAAGFVRVEVGDRVAWVANPTAERVLVLVHGVNDQAGSWFPVAPALAERWKVVIPDLAGHGESAPGDGPLPLSLLVSGLGAVIDAETAGPITLVGNSLGGWLAMLYTLEAPTRVEHLVLEAAGGLQRPFNSPVVARDREEALTILRAVHGPAFVAPEWVVDALIARAVSSPMLHVVAGPEQYVESRLSEIRVPTTILWGSDDGVLPLSYGEALRDGIAGARLHVIEGAAHIPHIQQPARFLECLTSIF